jgi:hypothetical protein
MWRTVCNCLGEFFETLIPISLAVLGDVFCLASALASSGLNRPWARTFP